MTRSLFYRLLVACAFGVLSFSRPALASDCYSVYSSYESCVNFGSCSPYSSPADFKAAYPQCFPGGSAASQVQVSASSFQQIGVVSSLVSSPPLVLSPFPLVLLPPTSLILLSPATLIILLGLLLFVLDDHVSSIDEKIYHF